MLTHLHNLKNFNIIILNILINNKFNLVQFFVLIKDTVNN